MSNAIEISGLTKTFGRTVALDDLNLVVAQTRSTDSWGPTAPGSPPPFASCWGCCAPIPERRAC